MLKVRGPARAGPAFGGMFPALKGLVLQRDRGNGAVLANAALVLRKGARVTVVAVRKGLREVVSGDRVRCV
jgi:hypothetical protein